MEATAIDTGPEDQVAFVVEQDLFGAPSCNFHVPPSNKPDFPSSIQTQVVQMPVSEEAKAFMLRQPLKGANLPSKENLRLALVGFGSSVAAFVRQNKWPTKRYRVLVLVDVATGRAEGWYYPPKPLFWGKGVEIPYPKGPF